MGRWAAYPSGQELRKRGVQARRVAGRAETCWRVVQSAVAQRVAQALARIHRRGPWRHQAFADSPHSSAHRARNNTNERLDLARAGLELALQQDEWLCASASRWRLFRRRE